MFIFKQSANHIMPIIKLVWLVECAMHAVQWKVNDSWENQKLRV